MINLILPQQLQELHALEAALTSVADWDAAARTLSTRVSGILGVEAGVLEREAGEWRQRGLGPEAPSAEALGAAWERSSTGSVSSAPARVTSIPVEPYGDWTMVELSLADKRPRLLAIAGDWRKSEAVLVDFAARLSKGLRSSAASARAGGTRGTSLAYRFARRLSRAIDSSQLYQMVARACGHSVNAQKASIAVYDEREGVLAIAATYGYPSVLVRHLRIASGSGIIGTVYLTGRPLRIEDVRTREEVPRPRLRYRTRSCMAVPLVGADGVLAVVSVADRRDGRPFDRRDLATLRGLCGVAALAIDRMRAMERAETNARTAATDPLTGLFNRRHFMLRLDEEVERARRHRTPLTALMLDVDGFKKLNDRLGHLGGDAVLRVIADVLRRSVRLFDVCARFGGDEFAILMPGSGVENGAQIAERIRQDLEGSRPPLGPWSDELRVTASIGIAALTGPSGEDLIIRADQALYSAKREGKNRVVVSS
jgi:diguanylate cyclase (GGDEF)-like protein